MAFVPIASLCAPPPRAAALAAARRVLPPAGASSCRRVMRPRAALENETGEKRSILSSIDNLLGGLLNLGGGNKVDPNAPANVPVDDADVPVRECGGGGGGVEGRVERLICGACGMLPHTPIGRGENNGGGGKGVGDD